MKNYVKILTLIYIYKIQNCILQKSFLFSSTKRLNRCPINVWQSHLISYSFIQFFTHFPFQFQQNKISCWAMLLLLEVFMVTIIILFINVVYCLFRYICGISRFRILKWQWDNKKNLRYKKKTLYNRAVG